MGEARNGVAPWTKLKGRLIRAGPAVTFRLHPTPGCVQTKQIVDQARKVQI